MSCPASGPYCSVKTVTSSCEAPGTSRFATCTGCAGSRASSTATPPDGQNCGCDESKKPQRPTYANFLYTNTSPLNPRLLRSFWPTAIMFSDDPLLVPLLLLPDESRKCCSFGNSSSFEAAPANADTASASAKPSTIRVLRMFPPFLDCGSWMPSSAVTTSQPSVNSCVCGLRWPSLSAPPTAGSLRSQISKPRVMSDSEMRPSYEELDQSPPS